MRHLVDPSDCHLLFECLPTISGTENILCNNIHFSVINIIYLHFNLAATWHKFCQSRFSYHDYFRVDKINTQVQNLSWVDIVDYTRLLWVSLLLNYYCYLFGTIDQTLELTQNPEGNLSN